jgi:glucosamine-6-phosphate deaminase
MNIIKVKNYDEISRKAAQYVIGKIHDNPNIKLGLATGGTPVGLYRELVKDHQENHTSYKGITTFNLDEYIGLTGENPNSYRYFMNLHLFNQIDINIENTFVPRGDAEKPEQQCLEYEALLKNKGGVDLQILGIGNNGHIAFNEPGTSFKSETHVIELDESTREANARFFNTIDEVPTHAITMGISSIMRGREIILLISGTQKQEAVSQLLHGEINENFPASVLKNHPNVTIIVDEAAMGNMTYN